MFMHSLFYIKCNPVHAHRPQPDLHAQLVGVARVRQDQSEVLYPEDKNRNNMHLFTRGRRSRQDIEL